MGKMFMATPLERMVQRASAPTIDCNLIANLVMLMELPHNTMIFDQLKLEHLYRLSQQSEILKKSSIAYILTEYRNKTVHIMNRNGQIVMDNVIMSYFLESVQNIKIYGSDDKLFRYIDQENKLEPKKIIFKDRNSRDNSKTSKINAEIGDLMKNTLKNVQHVEFIVDKFHGKVYDDLLKHAINIQQLKIVENSQSIASNAGYKSKWCFKSYPHLKSIQWDDGIKNERNFRYLLRFNPGIKDMIFSRNIPEALDFLATNTVKPNRISLMLCSADSIQTISTLYHQNIYKKLHLSFVNKEVLIGHINEIASLKALESITFPCSYHSSIGHLHQLKGLSIKRFAGNEKHILNELPLLEKLHIEEASIKSIKPIFRLRKLEEISIVSVEREILPDIDELIKERAQLNGACFLNLYVEEWAYIRLKKYSTLEYFINIKRIESLQVN